MLERRAQAIRKSIQYCRENDLPLNSIKMEENRYLIIKNNQIIKIIEV